MVYDNALGHPDILAHYGGLAVPVRSSKQQLINLNESYPCPCCRRGQLHLIVLTEALGCDQCQRIFVVAPQGQTMEQLSTSYPYKRTWRWTGEHWEITPAPLNRHSFSWLVLMSLTIMALLLALRGLLLGPVVAVLLFSSFLVMLWMARRR